MASLASCVLVQEQDKVFTDMLNCGKYSVDGSDILQIMRDAPPTYMVDPTEELAKQGKGDQTSLEVLRAMRCRSVLFLRNAFMNDYRDALRETLLKEFTGVTEDQIFGNMGWTMKETLNKLQPISLQQYRKHIKPLQILAHF